MKATLINGTRWLDGDDAKADFATLPNFHQGFGCINMPTTLPHPGAPDMTLEFVDNWNDPPTHFTRVGDRQRYVVDAEGGMPLRFCLVWTDLPARALQNNLNLFVQKLPAGPKHLGNENLPLKLRLPDAENNVEVVRLDAPDPGSYLIQITAGNLLKGGQDYALVIVGAGLKNFGLY